MGVGRCDLFHHKDDRRALIATAGIFRHSLGRLNWKLVATDVATPVFAIHNIDEYGLHMCQRPEEIKDWYEPEEA